MSEIERIRARFKHLDELEYELRSWYVSDEESDKVDGVVRSIRRYKSFLSHQIDNEKRKEEKDK